MMKKIILLTIAVVVSTVGVVTDGTVASAAETQANSSTSSMSADKKSSSSKSGDKKATDKKSTAKKAADNKSTSNKSSDKKASSSSKSKDSKPKKPVGPNIVKEIRDSVNTIVIDESLADFIVVPPEVPEDTGVKKDANGGKVKTNKTPAVNRNGFRVQVYNGNNSSERTARTRAVSSMYPAYQAGSAPYYKVHCGNFKTRAEADAAAARIRSRFPAFASEVRVVQSRINP